MSKTRWTAGFLRIKLSREKPIASGVGIYIRVFLVHALFGFACRIPRKNEEALLPPVWIGKMRK
jgi:hypothetical protein